MSKMFSKAASALSRSSDPDGKSGEEGESLTTILQTPEARSALTILIADCTEAMRQGIVDVFDAKETGKKSDLILNTAAAEEHGNNTTPNPDAQQDAEQKSYQEQEEKELAQREKELGEAKMQDVKAAALKHFDEWRASVMQRVGEVVNSREAAEKHKRQASPKQGGQENAVSPMRFPDQPKLDERVQERMMSLYVPITNQLSSLPQEQRALILHSILLLLLSLEHYQAHSRILLLRLSTSLHVPVDFLAHDENKVARVLLTAAESMSADEETKKAADENKSGRKWKVGLATVAGAALLGITGGLAAPLLAAGLGTVMGGLGLGATAAAGYLGTLAGSTVLVGGLFGAYGGRMTGKMMDQYAREVEDFAFVPVRDFHKPRKIEKEYRRLRVAIGISGYVSNRDGVVEPWKVLGTQLESFALRWEVEALLRLGNAITTMVKSAAWGYAKVEILKRTVFGALYAGLWPLGLLKIARVIDNPFAVANQRAQKAGEVLADALINKAQGERPVSLVGYSLGGKVIFTCLQRLAEQKAFGLIESVVLIGTPAPSTAADWRMIRSVAAGRVVNVYSTNDYILGFLYRSHSIQYGVAGLQAIENVSGVENADVSELVSGHSSYRHLNGTILQKIGFEDVDPEGLVEELEALKIQEAQEEAEREHSEGEKAEEGIQSPSDEDVINLEKDIQKKNEESHIREGNERNLAS